MKNRWASENGISLGVREGSSVMNVLAQLVTRRSRDPVIPGLSPAVDTGQLIFSCNILGQDVQPYIPRSTQPGTSFRSNCAKRHIIPSFCITKALKQWACNLVLCSYGPTCNTDQGWLDIYHRYISLIYIGYFRSKISDIFDIFDIYDDYVLIIV